MSSHMNRKYVRNCRKRHSEESSDRQDCKKPPKSSTERMRELRQRRKDGASTTSDEFVSRPPSVVRLQTAESTGNHAQTSAEGAAAIDSDNMEVEQSVSASPAEFIPRPPNVVHLSSVVESPRNNAQTSMEVNTASSDDNEEVEQATRDPQALIRWRAARTYFANAFDANEFGHACNVCDRLWFQRANCAKWLERRSKEASCNFCRKSLFRCEDCGSVNAETFSFCTKCGQNLQRTKRIKRAQKKSAAFKRNLSYCTSSTPLHTPKSVSSEFQDEITCEQLDLLEAELMTSQSSENLDSAEAHLPTTLPSMEKDSKDMPSSAECEAQ